MRSRLVHHDRNVSMMTSVPETYRSFLVPGAAVQYAAEGHAVLLQQKMTTAQYTVQLLHYWPVQHSWIEFTVPHRFAGWMGMATGELRLALPHGQFPFALLQPCVLQGLHLPGGNYTITAPPRQRYVCFIAVDIHSVPPDTAPAFARFLQRPAMRYAEWPVVFDPAPVPPAIAAELEQCYAQWRLRCLVPGEDLLDTLCALLPVAEKAVLTAAQPALHRAFGRYQLQVVKALLQAQTGQHLSLSQLAERVGLAADQLLLLARQYFGVSLAKFRVQLVMDLAKASVLHTDLPIREIAVRCGIRPAYFSPEFKRHWGQTPTEMRKGRIVGDCSL